MTIREAKLFTIDGSQAVRLPAEYRFPGEVVYLRCDPVSGEVVLSSRPPRRYADFMAARDSLGTLPQDFLSSTEPAHGTETRNSLAEIDRTAIEALTKATLRAAERLGLTNAALAEVVGVGESTISRLSGETTLALGIKPAELAAMLVRLCRSLDALVDNNDLQRRQWMASYNQVLQAVPEDAIRRTEGLVRAVTYLEGAQALT